MDAYLITRSANTAEPLGDLRPKRLFDFLGEIPPGCCRIFALDILRPNLQSTLAYFDPIPKKSGHAARVQSYISDARPFL